MSKMKLSIDKKIKNGKYYIEIAVSELTDEERNKITKFGSPEISIEPRRAFYRGKVVEYLPLHDFNQTFIFENVTEANQFERLIRIRIRQALVHLRSLKDNFSKEQQYEL